MAVPASSAAPSKVMCLPHHLQRRIGIIPSMQTSLVQYPASQFNVEGESILAGLLHYIAAQTMRSEANGHAEGQPRHKGKFIVVHRQTLVRLNGRVQLATLHAVRGRRAIPSSRRHV
jgi:hypothetical protein